MAKKDNSPKFRYTLKGWKSYIPFLQSYIDNQIAPVNAAIGNKSIDEVRWLLYNHLSPVGYYKAQERLISALNHKQTDKPSYELHPLRDDIWATYLNIPKEKRHNITKMILRPSDYRPSKGNVYKAYKLALSHSEKDDIINEALSPYITRTSRKKTRIVKNDVLGFNQNKVSNILNKYLGNHTIGRGLDSKGEYVSYYDLWDLNPIDTEAGEDASGGIGKPVNIYDRIYLDDYYRIPKENRGVQPGTYYGGYLPEIKVIGQSNMSKKYNSLPRKTLSGKY